MNMFRISLWLIHPRWVQETTPNCSISADYNLDLRVDISFFTDIIIIFQLSNITFFGVHVNYTKCDN